MYEESLRSKVSGVKSIIRFFTKKGPLKYIYIQAQLLGRKDGQTDKGSALLLILFFSDDGIMEMHPNKRKLYIKTCLTVYLQGSNFDIWKYDVEKSAFGWNHKL